MKDRKKYVVEKKEEKIVELEDLVTKKHIYININKLPKKIVEGDVLAYSGGKYVIDREEKEKRVKIIEEKFALLKQENIEK